MSSNPKIMTNAVYAAVLYKNSGILYYWINMNSIEKTN